MAIDHQIAVRIEARARRDAADRDHGRIVRADHVEAEEAAGGPHSADDVAGLGPIGPRRKRVGVGPGHRNIVDDADDKAARRSRIAVRVGDHHREAGAVRIDQAIVLERIGIGDRAEPGRRIVGDAGHDQLLPGSVGDRLRIAARQVQCLAAEGDRAQPVLGGEADAARNRFGHVVIVGAVAVGDLARPGRLAATLGQAALIDGGGIAARCRDANQDACVLDHDFELRYAGVAVAVAQRVAEAIGHAARGAGSASVAILAVAAQGQLAISALDDGPDRAGKGCAVDPGLDPDHGRAIGTDGIGSGSGIGRAHARDDVARRRAERARGNGVAVEPRDRRIVDDRDGQRVADDLAVLVGHGDADDIGRGRAGDQQIVLERIGIGQRPAAERVDPDRAFAGVDHLPSAGHQDTVDADRRRTVTLVEGDRPRGGLAGVAVGPCGRFLARALWGSGQCGLVDHGARRVRVRCIHQWRKIADANGQGRLAGVAVAITQRVGEAVADPARRARIADVAVTTVGLDRQGAVKAAKNEIAGFVEA